MRNNPTYPDSAETQTEGNMGNCVTSDIQRAENHTNRNAPTPAAGGKRRRGRPRLYASAAEKQAAYRNEEGKSIRVDREAYGELVDALEDVREAIEAAARRGDPLAKVAAGKRRTELLRALAAAIGRVAQPRNAKRAE